MVKIITLLISLTFLNVCIFQIKEVHAQDEYFNINDLYECFSEDKCSTFGRKFSYSDESNFVENTALIKSALARIYFSSPNLEVNYPGDVFNAYSEIKEMLELRGFTVVHYNKQKKFIFAKSNPIEIKSRFGIKATKTMFVISHVERSYIDKEVLIYFIVQPMKKRLLSNIYTSMDHDNESVPILRKLVKFSHEVLGNE